MKLPRLSIGKGRHRSTDPLGDPLERANDEMFPRVGAGDDEDDVVSIDLGPEAAPAPPAAAAAPTPSAMAEADDDAIPDFITAGDDSQTLRPDVELDLDFDPMPADATRRSARGMLSRLFGDPDDGGLRGLGGLSDMDGRPLTRGPGTKAAGIGAFIVVLGLGGWLLWPSGSQDEPSAVVTDAPATDGTDLVMVDDPDRKVFALPPLTERSEPDVVADPTAETDRSTDRRPWLTAPGEADGQGESAGESAGAGEGEVESADAGNPWAEMEAEGAAGSEAESPQTADADPPANPPAETDVAALPDPPPPAETGEGDDPGGEVEGNGGNDGVRARVDLAAPDIDLPDMPGLLPVPADVHRVVEPEAPNRMDEARAIPRYEDLPEAAGTRGAPLRQGPLSKLVGRSAHGPIPRIAEDGTLPWQAYAGPDRGEANQPRIAIVVRGLGRMNDALDAAITRLPPPVTLSFSPYAIGLPEKQGLARMAGHEVMIDLPMETHDFPADDPGPKGLLALLPEPETRNRLEAVLASGQGYVGVLASGPGPFATAPDAMEVVLRTLSEAGLIYVHQGGDQSLMANQRVAPALTVVDSVVDERGFAESIQARLDYLTRLAKSRGVAVGVMDASPLAFHMLRDWANGLAEQGIALVPVSAAVRHARTLTVSGDDDQPTPEQEDAADHG